ncbi:MAG: ribonucleoside triphosphate reductase [Rickettsiales bacterium]|nr:ribonucleoside triphosphate reductase [Rickettsiales bacterium]
MKTTQILHRHNLIEIGTNPYAKCQDFTVILRNGEQTPFSFTKISYAILKAGQNSGEFDREIAENLTSQVIGILVNYKEKTFGIEFIQDVIEEVLLRSPYKKTAKSQILYREQRAFIRKMSSQNKFDLIDQYLQKKEPLIEKTHKVNYSLQGLNNYIVSEISQLYWLDKIYPAQVKEAHTSGELHIHDLGNVSVYCVGWDLKQLLQIGFCDIYGKMTSKPAKHLRSALGHMVNFFYTLQNEISSAQTFLNVDTLLAPFIRYDKLDYKSVKQAIQEFIFNLNIPTHTGQAPFTNISFDIHPPDNLKEKHVIVGGKQQKELYKEFQKEMDMINEAFCEVLLEKDENQNVFPFPIPTYNITKNFNWDKPELKNLWKITAKYGTPHFINHTNPTIKQHRYMYCRLSSDINKIDHVRQELFTAHPLTGSIGIVTINLPRIGLLTQNKLDFISRLSKTMDIAKISLDTKRKTIEKFTDNNLYPFSKFYLQKIKENYGGYWQNHFSTIGFIGINEACINLLNKDLTTKEGNEFAGQIIDFMNKKAYYYKEETGTPYNIQATPATTSARRFAEFDLEKFTKIFEKHSQKYINKSYTNSSCAQISYNDSIFKSLNSYNTIQSTQHAENTMLNISLHEEIDIKSTKNLIKQICNDYKTSQITFAPIFSICSDHGHIPSKKLKCPICDKHVENYSKTVPSFIIPTQ